MSYYVNVNQVLDTGGELKLATDRIEMLLNELRPKVKAFLDANEGTAPDQFLAAQEKWDGGIQAMRSGLSTGVQKLDEIVENYTWVDQQGARTFNQI